jgi:acyl-coenzyme A synthetase/AMP-(fatty) acid ligase
MTYRVVDRALNEVPAGEVGELVVFGSQVTGSYWRDPETSRSAFISLNDGSGIGYRTGDLVRRPLTAGDPVRYLGRLDDQMQIRGHRVEMGEIEAVLRKISGIDEIVAIGWPALGEGVAGGVEAFVGDLGVDTRRMWEDARQRLPDYMVPREIHRIKALPLNAHGKVDRQALRAVLKGSE